MFASFFVSPSSRWSRSGIARAVLLATAIGAGGLTQAGAAPVCKPALTVKEAHLSPVHPETLERKWTALVSVDASRCATTSGHFEILFLRQKENAPEADFVEAFVWHFGAVEVSVDFWADEAVEAYWLGRVAACPCRD